MMPIIQTPTETRLAIAAAAPRLPQDLINMITSYTDDIDFESITLSEAFHQYGGLDNPDLRELCKQAFISSDCSVTVKSWLMFQIFYCLPPPNLKHMYYQQEAIRAIFNDIVASGYRVMLDGASLGELRITNVNWAGASLRGADLRDTVLTNVEMPRADLRDLQVDRGHWMQINCEGADLSGTDLRKLDAMNSVVLNDTR